MQVQTVHWPAVLNSQNFDELVYFADQIEFENATDVWHGQVTGQDRLIDSRGRIYNIVCYADANIPTLVVTQQIMNLETFSSLVRQHCSAMNQCCISKIHLVSYAQGMQLVKSMD